MTIDRRGGRGHNTLNQGTDMRDSNPPKTSIDRILAATGHSIRGLAAAWRNEQAFREEVVLAIPMFALAFWLGESLAERLLLVGSVMLVLICELLNSGIEATVDRIGTEHHELSGRAKDIGSAAVFLSLLNAGLVWGVIGVGRIFG